MNIDGAQQAFQAGRQAQLAGRPQDALSLYMAALEANPMHPGAHCNVGMIHLDAGRFETALAHIRIANEMLPNDGGVANNLGNVLWRMERYDEAKYQLGRARSLSPEIAGIWHNSALLYYSLNMLDESSRCYRRALKLMPDNPLIQSDAAYPILAGNDLQAGLKAHEARWGRLFKHPIFTSDMPRWQGEDLTGKTLFVCWEQGYGDTLQFSRFVPELLKRAARVIFSVQEPLRTLMTASLPGVEIAGSFVRQISPLQYEPDGIALPKADYYCPLMSLPLLLGTTLETIPPSVIKTPAIERSDYPRIKVGIIWAGNPGYDSDRRRSTTLDQFLALANSRIELYGLQMAPRSEDIQRLGAQSLVHDLSPHMTSFATTARLMAQLDAVVSVDTAPLHLAASLGIPTFAALPYTRCWRWLRHRDTSPWYPSLTLVQQKKPGEWPDVIDRIKRLVISQCTRQKTALNGDRHEAI